jgi:hypothetical protein
MNSATHGNRLPVTRRDALKRGAVVGGALAWTVPAIQVISLTAARAESPSAPPVRQPPAADPPVDGVPVIEPPVSSPPATTEPPHSTPAPGPSTHKPPTHKPHKPPAHEPTPLRPAGTPHTTAGAVPSGSAAPGGVDTFTAAGSGAAGTTQGVGGLLANTGPGVPLVPAVALAAGLIATGVAAQAARQRPAPVPPPAD